MGEESNVQSTAMAVAEILKAAPVYQDVLQPAAKQIGQSLETVTKTLNIVLAPIAVMVWGYETVRNSVVAKVAARLKDVPPEKITTPPANIAGPTMEALRYVGDNDELQQLYANLLAASINTETREAAHPAFVEIIRQLSPDEAKMLIVISRIGAVPKLDLRYQDKAGEGRWVLKHFTFVPIAASVEFPQLGPAYITNLLRLGLLEEQKGYKLSAPGALPLPAECADWYLLLEEMTNEKSIVELPELKRNETRVNEIGALLLTSFGAQFCKSCISEECFSYISKPGIIE